MGRFSLKIRKNSWSFLIFYQNNGKMQLFQILSIRFPELLNTEISAKFGPKKSDLESSYLEKSMLLRIALKDLDCMKLPIFLELWTYIARQRRKLVQFCKKLREDLTEYNNMHWNQKWIVKSSLEPPLALMHTIPVSSYSLPNCSLHFWPCPTQWFQVSAKNTQLFWNLHTIYKLCWWA